MHSCLLTLLNSKKLFWYCISSERCQHFGTVFCICIEYRPQVSTAFLTYMIPFTFLCYHVLYTTDDFTLCDGTVEAKDY